jgi:predicted PurR-regulated permease PerM
MNQHVTRAGKAVHSDEGLVLTDVRPLADIPTAWRFGAMVATLLMGMLALVAGLYFGRTILLPVTAALIVGITLSPIVKLGSRRGIPSALTTLAVIVVLVSVIGVALTFFVAPLGDWIARTPEIGAAIQEKMRVFEYPLSVLARLKSALMPGAPQTVSVEQNPAEMVGAVLMVVTPAVSEFAVFFGTLIFFLATGETLRKKAVIAFVDRDDRLRMLRIWNDIEENLVSYVGLVTMINTGLGIATAAMLYLVGFPNPLTFGLLTAVLNYVPYIGPAMVAIVLFGVGLVAMPSLPLALLAPALFVAIATAEGHFITPSIVGRRLTLSPFLVFLALAFWTWLWGPIGAFLAVPLVIMSLVVLGHLWPQAHGTLPE